MVCSALLIDTMILTPVQVSDPIQLSRLQYLISQIQWGWFVPRSGATGPWI